MSEENGPYRPLEGTKVIDIGMLVPAPLVTLRLSQLGADVVKVELPVGGDRLRHLPGTDQDHLNNQFVGVNRGKRSIGIDLRSAEGQEVFKRLAEKADVIVENALPGTWARLGIDFARLRALRPELIVCSITGFGQTGPLSHTPAHTTNLDALSGNTEIAEVGGRYVGIRRASPAFELASLHGALAICAALLKRERTGQGAWIDISCWDAVVEARRWNILQAAHDGFPEVTEAEAAPRPVQPFSAPYRTKDGKFIQLAALEQKFWANFCRGVGRDDLVEAHAGGELEFGPDDPRLSGEIQDIIAAETAEEWGRRFIDWDVAGCPILTPDEILHHPHFVERGLLEAEEGEEWANVTGAIRWHHSGERAGAGLRAAPWVDADRIEILRDWLGEAVTEGGG